MNDTAENDTAKKKFSSNFWIINTLEMGERLAYNNLRVVAPIYIMQVDNPGGLHLTATDKGFIYAWWAIVQSILPIFTGGLADRWGFKRTLTWAIPTIMLGYLMLATLRDLNWATALAEKFLANDTAHSAQSLANYWLFLLSITMLAAGSAFFKPGLQGTLGNILTKENSSMGWGIFYWVVNIGALVGHYIPSILLVRGLFGAEANSVAAWQNVFFASAFFTGLNLILLTRLKDVPSGASKTESIIAITKRTLLNIIEPRLFSFLAIMSGFWLMMYQLWDLQPNFIADWTDSSNQAIWLRENMAWAATSLTQDTARGPQILQNVLLSLNSIYIILGVVLTSYLTRKIRTLSAMLIGMGTATGGILIAGWTQNIWWLIFGILFFSIGEMTIGPKKSEYLALIAPAGKKGLYLGYVNIPAGIGILCGSTMAGFVYGNYGEKAILAQKYLAEKTNFITGAIWDGKVSSLETFLKIPRTEAMDALQTHLNITAQEATQLLWNTYNPHLHVWIPFAAIGVISAIALLIYSRLARRWKDMDA